MTLPDTTTSFDLTSNMRVIAQAEGIIYGVSGMISEHDYLLGYTIAHHQLDPFHAVRNYFLRGREDANRFAGLVREYGKIGDNRKVLDFAAGFGRVTRFLCAMLPDNRIVACDVHEEACSFLKTHIKVDVVQSSLNPTEFSSEPHDFIAALSFFSHLPDETFGSWISALYQSLEPEGILLFTTHGEAARRMGAIFFDKNFDEAAGFGFRPESDQEDLPSSSYGTMVVDASYVLRQLREHAPGAFLESYRSKSWFGLQDEWVIRRPADD